MTGHGWYVSPNHIYIIYKKIIRKTKFEYKGNMWQGQIISNNFKCSSLDGCSCSFENGKAWKSLFFIGWNNIMINDEY